MPSVKRSVLNMLKLIASAALFKHVYRNVPSGFIRIHYLEQDGTIVYQNRPSQPAIHPVLKFHMGRERERLIAKRNLDNMDEIHAQNKQKPFSMYNNFSSSFDSGECENDANGRICAGKFQSKSTKFAMVPLKKLIACLIPGNLPITIEAIMCYLKDSASFNLSQRFIHLEHPKIAFCRGESVSDATHIETFARRFFGVSANSMFAMLGGGAITVIRDPIERFLAAFVERCVRRREGDNYCNGCRQNLTCFIHSQYHKLISMDRNKILSVENEDFLPQNWYCDFNEYIDRYLRIRYAPNITRKFIVQLRDVLRRAEIPHEELKTIVAELHDYAPPDDYGNLSGTSRARVFYEEFLRTADGGSLLRQLVRMYYWDFKLFGYALPNGVNSKIMSSTIEVSQIRSRILE